MIKLILGLIIGGGVALLVACAVVYYLLVQAFRLGEVQTSGPAKHMEHTSVTSSNLASIGYDAEKRQMEVAFKNGSLYQFDHVPPELYAGMLKAPSPGKYFHAQVRGKYPTTKLK